MLTKILRTFLETIRKILILTGCFKIFIIGFLGIITVL